MKTIAQIKDEASKPWDFNLNHKWVVFNQATGQYVQSECSEHAANWAVRVYNQNAARFGHPASFIAEEVAYDSEVV